MPYEEHAIIGLRFGRPADIVVESCPSGLRFHLHEGAFGSARKHEFEVDRFLGPADLAEPAPSAAREDQINQQFEILPVSSRIRGMIAAVRARSASSAAATSGDSSSLNRRSR